MGIADDIINGKYQSGTSAYKKKKKKDESIADQIINGTYQDGLAAPTSIKTGFSDDIAPVKKKEEDKKAWYEQILQKPEAFKDGYQFGDISGTLVGSVLDVGVDIVNGAIGLGEGIGGFAAGGVAQVSDWIGQDEYAERLRNTIANEPSPITGKIKEWQDNTIDRYSVFGNTTDAGIEGIGQYLALGGVGKAAGALAKGASAADKAAKAAKLTQAARSATMFTSAAGHSLADSYQEEGIEDWQAWTRAIGTGYLAKEIEKIGGIFSSGGADKAVTNAMTNNMKSSFAKIATRWLGTGFAEGGEEGLEYIAGQVLDKGIDEINKLTSKNDATLYENWDWDEFWTGIFAGTVAGTSMGAGQTFVDTANVKKANPDMTWKEVINEVDRQQGIESQSELLTNETDKLRKKIEKTTDPTEALELQKEYEWKQKQLDALNEQRNQTQIQGLQQQIAQKEEEYNNSQDAREKQIIQETINGLNEELNELTNAQQITDESELRKQNFTYEANENDSDIKKAVYESASKVMNNTETTHKFVDVVAKIAEERGTTYKFTNNEQLKQLGYVKEGITVNGLVNENGEVLINIDSAKELNTVVGHETTHLLEGTKEYDALKQVAIEYAKSKGDYDARIEKLTKLYEGTNADIEAELTSDIVGEYLFTDENFVKELSIKQPTIFEKIKNFISDLVVKFKGTDQEKQLRQLQRTFEKAYKAQGTQTSTDTKYSLYNEDKALYDYKGDIKAEGQGFTKSDKKMLALLEKNDINAIDNQKEFIRTAIDRERRLGNELWAERLQDAFYRSKKEREHTIKQYLEKYKNENSRVKYSVSDNQGRTLTKEQQEYFKDSKVRDKNGNLLTVYHGTKQDFTVFENKLMGKNAGNALGEGYYFTSYKADAEMYKNLNNTDNKGKVLETYIDIKNPLNKSTYNADEMISKVDEIVSIVEPTRNQNDEFYRYHRDYVEGKLNTFIGFIDYVKGFATVQDTTSSEIFSKLGYDGIIDGNEYVVFNSNQVKNVDNTKPTSNPDIRYSLSEDTKGRKLSKEQIERYKDVSDKLKDENGNLKIYYHGTQRADRVGTLFDPNRATSGPMAFFTDSEEIATNYSTNKSDTSLSREYDTEYDLFKVDGQDLDSYWNSLSYTEKQKINKEGNNVGFDDDWENIKYGENASEDSFSDMYKWYLKNETNGNGIKALYQVWIQDGNIMDDDLYKFQEVLEKAGVKNVEFLDPYKTESKVYETYLNIKNPFDTSNMSEDIINQFKEASKTATIGEQYSADAWDKSNIAPEAWISKLESDIEEGTTHAWTVIPDWVTNVLKANGYDGIVDTGGKNGGVSHQVVIPFYSEQVKDVNNQKPTDNPNIDMSLSAQNEEIAPTGQWNVRGEDIKLQVEEAIAPLQEKIESLTEQLETVVNSNKQPTMAEEITNLMNIKETQSGSDYARAFFDLRDKYGQPKLYKALNEYYATGTVTEPNEFDNLAPTSQDIVEKQGQENFEHLPDDLIPPEIDETEFAPDEDTYEDVSSPVQERDIQEVGNRKVKAYQYEHPEVRPYFQVEADNMLGELSRRIEGERYPITGEDGYTVEWTGISRSIPEDIAYLKDNYGYSYEQIEKGLKAIIEDNGAENNAVSKRLEILIDERLTNGYVDFLEGYPIPPNQEYKNLLIENDAADYYSNLAKTLDDADMLPEQATMNVEPELKVSEQVIPQQTKTAQKGNLKDTSVETQKQERAAKIMAEAPTPQNRKQRQWAKFVMNFIDKGSPFEDLSLKTKNRELMGKWDSMLTSAAKAQNTMINGVKKIDALNKVEEQVSKSLDDIRTKVVNSGKVQEFYEYMYHSLNTDRMSLESKAQAKMAQIKEAALKEYDDETIEKLARRRITDKTNEETAELIESAKEYIRLSETKNKPVFGDSVTAEMSQKAVEEFEMANPEFTEWAKDVYQYNNALRDLMVENNIISQETADLFAEMYPHYVPIKRIDTTGNAINVPLDTNRTSINTPIKRAKGGNQDILPMFDTMAGRTLQTYKAIAKNNFGIELKNTLKSTIDNQQTNMDEILDNVDQQEGLLQEGKNGQAPTFTVFEKGNKVTYEITQDMYDALKPISDSSLLKDTYKIPNAISNFHRGVLTEFNIVFGLTNPIKDVQDVLLNSQHATKTYVKIPEACLQIARKGMWYKEYMANGGEQNSYFDSQDNTYGKESITDKILPLKGISKLNNFIELAPRLAEYIASRESGRSVEVSMLDAARVTTNFKAGGDITKWANRNGATFLNASMQGIAQQVRNVREAHSKGLKGYANLATKFALAGLPAMILNGLLWEDDEEYEELSDYVKTNYWIVGKYGDGNFIRIPKGRMITVIQESFNQMKHLITGDEQADLNSFLEVLGNNLAPNNPVSDNILSPIVQAVTNKTWYGGDLVPTRLQDVPEAEQYDESIDKFSIEMGQKTGISPYKINYVLDQYTGGVGDVFLPMMTQQAEGGKDDLASNLLAPLVNKFTVDSTMKNQSVSDLYELSDKLTTKANSSKATDEDILKNKFIDSVKTGMNELYKKKREIQNSDLPDSEKYEQVREIQEQINYMAKAATRDYEDMDMRSNYADVGGIEYYKNNDGEWTKVREEEASELNELGMSYSTKNTYFKTKNEISKIVGIVKDSKDSITIDDEDSEEYKEAVKYLNSEKKADIVDKIVNSGLKDSEKAYLYKKFYNSDTIDTMVNTNISVDDYLVYTTKEFKADYNNKGNAISGSRKNKVIDYVNTLNLDIPQKAILIKSTNTFKFNDYNNAIVEYVGGLNIDYEDKVKILKDLDMTVDDEGNVYWE